MEKNMKFLLSFLLSFFPMVMMAQQKMTWEEAYRQADEIVAKLTLDEKLHFMRGYSEFFFYGVPEKGIPYIYHSDATGGINIRRNLPDTTWYVR